MNITIVIFASELIHFEKLKAQISSFATGQIVLCHSKHYSRADILKNHPEEWVLFLDADCELTTEVYQWLYKNLSVFDQNKVYAGSYINPNSASYLQKAHNHVANLWLQKLFMCQAHSGGILGGVFLLYAKRELDFSSLSAEHFWGGEDKYLMKWLRTNFYDFELQSELKVIHHTSKKMNHFLRRAWLHGVNDVRYLNENISFRLPVEKQMLLHFLKQVNWALTPAIVLHFLIQKFGKLFQSLRHTRKKEMSGLIPNRL